MKVTIYYFSATGNGLKVAKDLSTHFDNIDLIRITQNIINKGLNTDSDIIGFISPSIFSGIPKLVASFISSLKIKNTNPYIFSIATHGDKNGEGLVFNQIDKVLKEKDLSLNASFAIRMPHNMPAKDHITTDEQKEEFFNKEKELIPNIAQAIKNRTLVEYKQNNIRNFLNKMNYHGIHSLAKKSPFDKGFSVDDKCISCTICSKVCPADNIEIIEGRPKWKLDNCQFCFACVQWCPKDAIQYKSSTIGIKRYHQPDVKVNELFTKNK